MDYRRKLSSIPLVLSQYPWLLLLMLTAAAGSGTLIPSDLISSASGVEKVTLGLYYESLCPYCSNFIVNHLVKLFDSGLISVVNLQLFPYGNAKVGANDTITCQHGPSECLLNTVEACAISTWPDLNTHFPFIYCVETLVYEHKYPEWETCFDKLGLDPAPISECYSSGKGIELELKYAAETSALLPPHQYVPWVVVDGEPLYEDYENFMSYICKAYKGTTLPNACTGLSLHSIRKGRAPVCFREAATKSTLSKIRTAIVSLMDQVGAAVSA